MSRLKRVLRLLRHYERIQQEKAALVTATRLRISAAESRISEAHHALALLSKTIAATLDGDINLLERQLGDAYRRSLRGEIAQKRAAIQLLHQNLTRQIEEATVAHRELRTWEQLRDKLEALQADERVRGEQFALDEAAQIQFVTNAGPGNIGRQGPTSR